jgi:hypothetical protein
MAVELPGTGDTLTHILGDRLFENSVGIRGDLTVAGTLTADGAVGTPGPMGPAGPEGPMGPAGPTGPGGPSGAAGVLWVVAPTISTGPGAPGQMAYDADFLYVAVATSQWKRIALVAF